MSKYMEWWGNLFNLKNIGKGGVINIYIMLGLMEKIKRF